MRIERKSVAWFGVFVLAVTLVRVSEGDMGDGVKIGAFRAHPYIESQLTYDSNVFRTDANAKNDESLSLTPGVNLNQFSDTALTEISLWGRFEQYASLTERNHQDFGERIATKLWDRDVVQLKLSEGFKNVEEFDTSVGDIEQRGMLNVAIGAGKDLTDKVDLDVAYTFDMTSYQSPSLYDWSQHLVSAELGHAMTDKSAATLTVKAGSQSSDGSADGTLGSVLVGAKTRLTEKVKGRLGLGWYGYDAGGNNLSLVGYDAMLSWQAAPKVVLNTVANNGVQPATQDADNFQTVSKISLAGTWTPVQKISGTLSGSYIKNDYQQPVSYGGSLVDKNDETTSVSLRVDYKAPARFLALFGEVRLESKTASIQAYQYDQVVGLVGMNLMY